MLEFGFNFGNRGGLASIYAVTPNAVRSLTKNYRSGKWQLTLWNDKEAHDAFLVHIPVRSEEKNWEENDMRDENGVYFSNSITGKIPGCKANEDGILDILLNNRWLVITMDNNREWRLSGSVANPLTFTCDKTSDSAVSGYNAITFIFSGESDEKSRYLELFDDNSL